MCEHSVPLAQVLKLALNAYLIMLNYVFIAKYYDLFETVSVYEKNKPSMV